MLIPSKERKKRKEQKKKGRREKILSKAPGTGNLIREFPKEIPLRNR